MIYQVDEMLYRMACLSDEINDLETDASDGSSAMFEMSSDDATEWKEPLMQCLFRESDLCGAHDQLGNKSSAQMLPQLPELLACADCADDTAPGSDACQHQRNWRNLQSKLELEIFRQLQLGRDAPEIYPHFKQNQWHPLKSLNSTWSGSSETNQENENFVDENLTPLEIDASSTVHLGTDHGDSGEWMEMEDCSLCRHT